MKRIITYLNEAIVKGHISKKEAKLYIKKDDIKKILNSTIDNAFSINICLNNIKILVTPNNFMPDENDINIGIDILNNLFKEIDGKEFNFNLILIYKLKKLNILTIKMKNVIVSKGIIEYNFNTKETIYIEPDNINNPTAKITNKFIKSITK